MRTLSTGLAALIAVGIIYIGMRYLLAPQSTASTFGLPAWPTGEADGFLAVKGVRDLASGLLVAMLLVTGHRRALGWALLAATVIPVGDMLVIVTNDGLLSTAYGVHGATAAMVAATAALLLRESARMGESPRHHWEERTEKHHVAVGSE